MSTLQITSVSILQEIEVAISVLNEGVEITQGMFSIEPQTVLGIIYREIGPVSTRNAELFMATLIEILQDAQTRSCDFELVFEVAHMIHHLGEETETKH